MSKLDTTKYQTREVLAGAYRGNGRRGMGQREDRATLTHLCEIGPNGHESKVLCDGVKLDHIADENCGSVESLSERPTCKRCAAKYDKIFLEPRRDGPLSRRIKIF